MFKICYDKMVTETWNLICDENDTMVVLTFTCVVGFRWDMT